MRGIAQPPHGDGFLADAMSSSVNVLHQQRGDDDVLCTTAGAARRQSFRSKFFLKAGRVFGADGMGWLDFIATDEAGRRSDVAAAGGI